jgi:hypothetical protein
MELALCAALGVTVVGLTWRWSRRKPGVPLSWQTSQSVAAELHRRMHRAIDRTRATVADARKRGVPTETYAALVDELFVTARAIDDQLVLASRLPFRQRHKTLLTLRYRISDLERTGARIGSRAVEAASPLVDSVDESIARINQRLDHVDEARDELRELGGNS